MNIPVRIAVSHELYQMFVHCIALVMKEYKISVQSEISVIMRELYKVNTSVLRKTEDDTNTLYVEFQTEQDYTWFLLRWS